MAPTIRVSYTRAVSPIHVRQPERYLMRAALLLTLALVACHQGPPPSPASTPQTVLAPGTPGPDTITCDQPVLVSARSDRDGVNEERAWLNNHYPGHSSYGQRL